MTHNFPTGRWAFMGMYVVVLAGCGVDSASLTELDEALADTGQGLGTDSSDRGCQVVLRQAERVPGPTGGFATSCNRDGVCYYLWQGVIDVARAAKKPGTTVWVQYKSTDSRTWTRKQAAQAGPGPEGFLRYTFRLDSKTVGPGMSSTSMQRARLEILPYLRSSDGSRVFDHNRRTQEFDSYALVANNQWSIPEDAMACRPEGSSVATLDFKGDYSEVQHGPLLARGKGVIHYDLNRLPVCRGTHNGYPAWDITATVKFDPQGTTVERSVRAFDSPNGVPDISKLHAVPFEFTIPQGTQRVQVWFINTGLWCGPLYDSNQGANYQFDVSTVAPASIGWVGNQASSLSRSCMATGGIPEPIVLDEYSRERACSFVELDVWAKGLTDVAAFRPALLVARAELSLDGVTLPNQWLDLQGKFENNYRYRFTLPRADLYYGARWSTLKYALAFSTDGVTWVRDTTRTVNRDPSWCNPAWASCD